MASYRLKLFTSKSNLGFLIFYQKATMDLMIESKAQTLSFNLSSIFLKYDVCLSMVIIKKIYFE